MTYKFKKTLLGAMLTTALMSGYVQAQTENKSDRPNVVLVFLDDAGFADISANGGRYPTPNIDQLANEGVNLSSFYVSSPVSSPSRAGLLTGRLESRTGMYGTKQSVLFEDDKDGLPKSEVTLAKMLSDNGYQTAMFGKWHLGIGKDGTEFIPTRYGFDEWYGIPTSNDMFFTDPNLSVTNLWLKQKNGVPKAETDAIIKQRQALTVNDHGWGTQSGFSVPVYHSWSHKDGTFDDKILGVMQQATFTEDLTNRTIDFIKNNKDKPFFVYLPYAQNHVPLFVSDKFKGKTDTAYGDVMTEIDDAMGRIMQTLKEQKLDENTIVIFTSDNGPRLGYERQGASGSALPYRDGKTSTFEGGQRVPAIIRWSGHIKPRKTDEMLSTLDIMPTLAKLTGAKLPQATLDGYDASEFLLHNAPTPRKIMPYYYMGQLQAYRNGEWKIHFIESGHGGKKKLAEPELYNMNSDSEEQHNVAKDRPDIVKQLSLEAEQYHKSLGSWKEPLFNLEALN